MKITAHLIHDYEYTVSPGWSAFGATFEFSCHVHGERDRDGSITVTDAPDDLQIKVTDGYKVVWVEPDSHLYCRIMDFVENRHDLQWQALADDGEMAA